VKEWIDRTVESFGYFGVVFLTFLENLFPPIPSEIVMPLAGFAASRGEMSVWGTVAAGAAGSLFGTSIYYLLGRKAPEERLRRWIRAHGRWMALREDDLDKAKDWFARHGKWALLVCRFVPGVRTIISLPAGICQTSPSTFLLYSAAGVLIWTCALTYAGAALGENFDEVGNYVRPLSSIVLASLLIAFVVFVYRRRRAKS
jgi:membrane protein DedA with SNARE-associated domain